MNSIAQIGASQTRNRGSGSRPPPEAHALRFEVVQPQSIRAFPHPPRLRKIEIPKLIYAIALRVLYNFCYDMRWDRLSHRILVHKFTLFPECRRWQIEKWVAQIRRQNLFPNASEPELRQRAKELVMSYLI